MAKTQVEKDMETRRKTIAERNAEAEKRMSESTPTPTQDENDRAAVGMPTELEPDGSPSEADEAVRRAGETTKELESRRDAVKAAETSAAASYKTREAKKD